MKPSQFMFYGLLLSLGIFFASAKTFAGESDGEKWNDEEFEFWVGEFFDHQLEPTSDMAKSISLELAKAVFSAPNEKAYFERLDYIRSEARSNPERLKQLDLLSRQLKIEAQKRMDSAKKSKIIWAVSGAVVGALIALPLGRFTSKRLFTSTSSKLLWIAVPVGVAAGAAAAYYISDLFQTPAYAFESDLLISGDLKEIHDTLARFDQE